MAKKRKNPERLRANYRHILEFERASVVVWPDLERIAIVSPFDSSSISFDECIDLIAKTKKSRKGKRSNGA